MKRKVSAALWGLFFLAGAALIILSALGYLANVGFWSIVLAVLLAGVIVQSILYFNFFGILVPLALIAIVFAEPLGITAITPWPVLIAAVLASIGLSILFRKKLYKWHEHEHHGCGHDGRYHGEYHETVEEINDNVISSSVSFGESAKYLHATSLERANFSCNFGSLKVFFGQAQLSENGASVHVECSFGAIELYVPSNWKVIDRVTTNLGGVDNTSRAGSDGPVMTLDGNVSLGAIKVIYV